MKFILGYLPNTKSEFYEGPKVLFQLSVKHKGKRYFFNRMQTINGIINPTVLAVYDTNDYPDDMIEALLNTKQIVEWHGDKIATAVDNLDIRKGNN